MLELLGGVILALLAAMGFQYWRSKNKEVEVEREKAERANYAMNELERVRQAAAAARARANKEYKAPIDVKARKDFE